MGIYVNRGNESFASARNSKIYVDKTGLIEYTNEMLGTEQRYICNSRPRRFGKSMAAGMLAAYYVKGYDSRDLFEGLEIAGKPSFENFEGLRGLVVQMLAGARCVVDTDMFQNDITSFKSKDDVVTALIHLGYLAYDSDTREAYVPNEEVRTAFARALKDADWEPVDVGR